MANLPSLDEMKRHLQKAMPNHTIEIEDAPLGGLQILISKIPSYCSLVFLLQDIAIVTRKLGAFGAFHIAFIAGAEKSDREYVIQSIGNYKPQ